ncbi:trehalase-like [Amphiura filiformis]|uniref:trehalase-like n=1 Tax=Amphiura filiformis TaxID=82378 RepID=UPI003B22621B
MANETNEAFEAARKVFCDGQLLEAVQRAKLYDDCKTFVDMHLKRSPEETLTAFKALEDQSNPQVLDAFLSKYFEKPGDFERGILSREFEQWIPEDWEERPAFLPNIKDGTLRD